MKSGIKEGYQKVRKRFRATSILLAAALLFSVASAAFAASTDPTTITCDDFDAVETLAQNTRTTYEIELSNTDATVAAQSSEGSVLGASVQADPQNPGYFTLTLEAFQTGKATVTLTASDGTEKERDIAVEEASADPDYTISSDPASDFSLPAGNSRYITIHYESDNLDVYTAPTLTSDDDSVIHVEQIGADFSNDDYYFRVDAVGKDGRSATLSAGSTGYLSTEKLCTASVAENKDLRVDTQSTYVCNTSDVYDFVVATGAATPPQVSAGNELVSVSYVGKVPGGYQYEMEAEDTGGSVVQVKSGDETAGFAVQVNEDEQPSVVSTDPKAVSVAQGGTYTYHFDIMGGGAPQFVTDPADTVAVKSVKKDGIHYACTVVASGDVGSSSELSVTFPDGGEDFTVDAGKITVTEPTGTQMKSDTNHDFTLAYGQSYQFRITGATDFYPGSSGAFRVVKAGQSEDDTFYRITAVGKPGDAAGFYMRAPDRNPVLVCVVTVGNVTLSSDTHSDFSLAKGATYQYKITAPGVANASDLHFNAGSSGVVQTAFAGKSGYDFFYRVTATGKSGQATGLYVSAFDQKPQRVNVVTVKPIEVTSDTNSDFSLAKGQSYQFKITAPGASSVTFNAGSAGVVSVTPVSHRGDDFFFRVTAVGKSGQATGIYTGAKGQSDKKVCVVTVK